MKPMVILMIIAGSAVVYIDHHSSKTASMLSISKVLPGSGLEHRVKMVDIFEANEPGVVAARRLVMERAQGEAWVVSGAVQLQSAAVLLDDAIVDRNGDGVVEVAVVDGNDGNCWSCARLRLLQPKTRGDQAGQDAGLVDVLDVPALDVRRWPVALRDVDGDGQVEVIVDDISWEDSIPSLCHTCTPRPSYAFRFVVDGAGAGGLVKDDEVLRTEQIAAAQVRWNLARQAGNAQAVLSEAIMLALLEGVGTKASGDAGSGLAQFDERLVPFAHRLDPQDIDMARRRLWSGPKPLLPWIIP